MANDSGVLGEGTRVKLSLAGGLMLSLLGGSLWISNSMQGVKDGVSDELKILGSEVTKVAESTKLNSVQLDNLEKLVTVQLGVATNDIALVRADVKELENRIRALELIQNNK